MPSADCNSRPIPVGFRILNMFDMDIRPTIEKSVVESADSGIESADSIPESADFTTDYASNPLRISLWVRAFSQFDKN